MPIQKKNCFIEGPIPPAYTGEVIGNHARKTNIGAHTLYLGQVRADEIEGKQVSSIEYSTYQTMANEEFNRIKEDAIAQYGLTCVHIYHSLGEVKAGELSLFVMVSAPHRQAAFEGQQAIVEAIKARVPIWGKEIFAGGGYQWKSNDELIKEKHDHA